MNIKDGGLGLQNIAVKAEANLITRYIHMSIYYYFVTYNYSKAFLNFLLKEVGVRNSDCPPWLFKSTFTNIKEALKEGISIQTLKIKDKYS